MHPGRPAYVGAVVWKKAAGDAGMLKHAKARLRPDPHRVADLKMLNHRSSYG
jgi:hypothetical protein